MNPSSPIGNCRMEALLWDVLLIVARHAFYTKINILGRVYKRCRLRRISREDRKRVGEKEFMVGEKEGEAHCQKDSNTKKKEREGENGIERERERD